MLREDLEREDDPRAGMGMDDAEEVLPEEHCQEAGGRKVLGKIQETDHHLTTSGPPEEHPAPRVRWGLSPGCSEARPLQMKLRVADEVLALYSGGSPGERTDRQGDGSNWHRTENEGGVCHRGKRRRIKVGASGGAPCGALKDDGEVSWMVV